MFSRASKTTTQTRLHRYLVDKEAVSALKNFEMFDSLQIEWREKSELITGFTANLVGLDAYECSPCAHYVFFLISFYRTIQFKTPGQYVPTLG